MITLEAQAQARQSKDRENAAWRSPTDSRRGADKKAENLGKTFPVGQRLPDQAGPTGFPIPHSSAARAERGRPTNRRRTARSGAEVAAIWEASEVSRDCSRLSKLGVFECWLRSLQRTVRACMTAPSERSIRCSASAGDVQLCLHHDKVKW